MSISPSDSDDKNPALLGIGSYEIVPVIVIDDHTRADDLADALVAGGLPPAEATLLTRIHRAGRGRRRLCIVRGVFGFESGRRGEMPPPRRSRHSLHRNGRRTANGCGGRPRPCQVLSCRPDGRPGHDPSAERTLPAGSVHARRECGIGKCGRLLGQRIDICGGRKLIATRTPIEGGHFDEIVRLIREARSMVAAARLHWTP